MHGLRWGVEARTGLRAACLLGALSCSEQLRSFESECAALDAGAAGFGSTDCPALEALITTRCDGGLSGGDAGVLSRWTDPEWDCQLFLIYNCASHFQTAVCEDSFVECRDAFASAQTCADILSLPCSLVCVE